MRSGARRQASSAVALTIAIVVLPAPPTAAQTPAVVWLDRPLAGWNMRGAPLPPPAPSSGTAEPPLALAARCELSLTSPTDAERTIAAAGWIPFRYFDRQLREHDLEIVGGLTGSDGMCRPTGFNVFVFVAGRFAGTLSPVVMDSRADGVSGAIRILSAGAVSAEYARYAEADALCCPSSRVTVTFQVDRAAPPAVIVPASIRTTRGS